MRVKILKDYEELRAGQVVRLTATRAKLLIKSGAAAITKDIVRTDLKET